MEKFNGPLSICQSCAMPLAEASHHGTEADGSRSADYCRHCYRGGAFTQPEVGMEDMRDFVIDFVVREGHMTLDEARATMERVFPTLKRWRT